MFVLVSFTLVRVRVRLCNKDSACPYDNDSNNTHNNKKMNDENIMLRPTLFAFLMNELVELIVALIQLIIKVVLITLVLITLVLRTN